MKQQQIHLIYPYNGYHFVKKFIGNSEGKLICLFASLFTALNFTAMKYLLSGVNMPPPMAVFSRYFIPLIFASLLGLYYKTIAQQKNWYYFAKDFHSFKILTGRSILHWLSNMLAIYSLSYIELTINITIFYIWPIFGIILGHFLLDEKMNLFDLLCGICGCVGVLFLTDPQLKSFNEIGKYQMIGIVLIILAAFLYGVQSILLRCVFVHPNKQ